MRMMIDVKMKGIKETLKAVYILILCNPYHLANPSSHSKHDIMFVYLHHLSMS